MTRQLKHAELGPERKAILQAQGGLCAMCFIKIKEGGATLDHDHSTGFLRAVLCRNCNGIEGKIKNLARRGQRKFDHSWFLKRVIAYWDTHDGAVPDHGLIHPLHKSDEDKRIRTNKLAKIRRDKAKAP